METINQDIIKYSKELKLPIFRRDYKELAIEAVTGRLDYEEFLLKLMEREYESDWRIGKNPKYERPNSLQKCT